MVTNGIVLYGTEHTFGDTFQYNNCYASFCYCGTSYASVFRNTVGKSANAQAAAFVKLHGGKPIHTGETSVGDPTIYRCQYCSQGILEKITGTHSHPYTGTHYVCSAHNYVGTSQLH